MKTVKRTGFAIICCTLILLLLLPDLAFAHGGQRRAAQSGKVGGIVAVSLRDRVHYNLKNFVDANGDGVCDYFDFDRSLGCTDENADGLCDNWGAGRNGRGQGFGRGCRYC